jgi:HSP20 family protein
VENGAATAAPFSLQSLFAGGHSFLENSAPRTILVGVGVLPTSVVSYSMSGEIIMANLARFDPFSLTRMDPFESMVRDFMPTTVRSMLRPMTEPTIAIEVQEMDNAYLVAAELPGVKKEDIDISITGNQVTLNAECKQEKMAAEAREWCSERWYGKVSRTIQLPLEIEETNADATYADGVLHLTLPKKASSMAKKLEIH